MAQLSGKFGFFFCYFDENTARQDFHSFCEIARSSKELPCDFTLHFAQWSRRYPYVIALILPMQFENHMSRWLSQNKIQFGNTVDGSPDVVDFHNNSKALEESESFIK